MTEEEKKREVARIVEDNQQHIKSTLERQKRDTQQYIKSTLEPLKISSNRIKDETPNDGRNNGMYLSQPPPLPTPRKVPSRPPSIVARRSLDIFGRTPGPPWATLEVSSRRTR